MPYGLKRLIKQLLAAAVYYSGLLRLILLWRSRTGRDPGFVILMYHRVVDPEDPTNRYTQAGMSVTHETFKKQATFLADKYRIRHLAELVTELKSGRPILPGSVVITFDDGWQDNFRFGLPVLTECQAPATIFLTTDFIESEAVFWFLKVGVMLAECPQPESVVSAVVEAAGGAGEPRPFGRAQEIRSLDELLEFMKRLDADRAEEIAAGLPAAAGMDDRALPERRWTLSWEEIREMKSRGIAFGSHGRSHRILTTLDSSDARRELVESKRILERELGETVNLFAYPNGEWNAEVRELAKGAGYAAAIATGRPADHPSSPDLFALGRVGIHEGVSQGVAGRFSRALFACAIHGVFPFR